MIGINVIHILRSVTPFITLTLSVSSPAIGSTPKKYIKENITPVPKVHNRSRCTLKSSIGKFLAPV